MKYMKNYLAAVLLLTTSNFASANSIDLSELDFEQFQSNLQSSVEVSEVDSKTDDLQNENNAFVVQDPSPRYGKGDIIKLDDVKFIGKGFYDKKTKNSIALVELSHDQQSDLPKEIQFIEIYSATNDARIITEAFLFGSKKQFENRMSNLEQYSRNSPLHSDARGVVGGLMLFGSPAAVFIIAPLIGLSMAAAPIVAGALFVSLLAVVYFSKNHYESLDIFSMIPRAIHEKRRKNRILSVNFKEGWNWSSEPVKMRHGKYIRVLETISNVRFN